MQRFTLVVLSSLLLSLGGCFWKNTPVLPEPEPETLSPVVQFMVSNSPGATALIQDETFGGEVRVSLEDSFVSAAGETCKRATLLSAQQEAEIIVICRSEDSGTGHWRLMPRIWGRGI